LCDRLLFALLLTLLLSLLFTSPLLLLLQELDLGDPDADIITIDDLGLTALTGLSHSLKRLGLSRCRWVSDAAFVTLRQLSQLEVLDLSHTDVGPRGLAALAGLPNLHTINLTGCRCVLGGGGSAAGCV
jgi:hypothetical protein